MWKHYAALKNLLLFTNCWLEQTWHKVIQNKKFDGGKCEENVSDKTRVIIESTQRGENVCKTLKRREKEGKNNSSTRNWPVWGFITHRSHFPRVLNKQHNPPKKIFLERLSWMKTRQMGFYFYTLFACIFAFFFGLGPILSYSSLSYFYALRKCGDKSLVRPNPTKVSHSNSSWSLLSHTIIFLFVGSCKRFETSHSSPQARNWCSFQTTFSIRWALLLLVMVRY